jgi:DNA-binding SARP family transcriptional activator/class 3 adenylate cyclase
MEVRLLGRLEVVQDGRQVAPQRTKQRALVAMLCLHANEVVRAERLIDALWGDAPPPTAAKALQGHVSAVRKLVGAERIETAEGGYLLRVYSGELDVERFETLIDEARGIADPEQRSARLLEALQLWRGEPLAEFRNDDFAASEAARLEELRLSAVEERLEAELQGGRHDEALPQLEGLVAANQLRERLRALHMLALYRAGRQADALRAYQEARRFLADELGLDPGPALQTLERQILAQDPALEPPRPPGPSPLRQERKRVAVVVAELLVGGVTDPEDLQEVLGPRLDEASALVERFGGRAQQLFANALLGVFGAAQAHEDDAERAVRAALALRTALAGSDCEVRAGVDSGEALVTLEGDRVEVTGDVLASASRLQANAAAQTVLVGEAARRATAGAIEYVESGSRAWSAQAARRPVPTRESDGHDAPFTGREDELARLERTFARAARERSVQLVTVVGEPGAGKTRLVAELRPLLAGQAEHVWREGRCLAYGDGITYWALGEVVKQQAGILESDGPAESSRKLAATVAALVEEADERAWLEPSLAPLVGIHGVAASVVRDQAFAAWRQFLERIASQAPLVLVLEDLHWADDALVEFVRHLVERASAPMLVVCTARLEFLDAHPGWSARARNATSFTLVPLSEEQTEGLLRSLLGRDPTPDEVRRSGGNPLFAHELARIEPVASRGLPESLEAVIAARLDTLPPAAKEAAMDAAVVGEVCWSGAVAAIGGLDEDEASERLRALAARDVVRQARRSSVAGQEEYAFLHALVRDVAYGQIPRRIRAAKHVAAAEWIAQLAGERVGDHAELVAHHYEAALALVRDSSGNTAELAENARRFLVLAGDRAMRLDVGTAEQFFARALELMAPDDPRRATIVARLADTAQEDGRLRRALELYEQAIAAFRAQGAELEAGKAMTNASMALWRLGETARSRALIDEAVGVLEQLPLGTELVRAWMAKGRDLEEAGEAEASLPWIERARAAADELGLAGVGARLLHFRGWARVDLGDAGGIADLRESIRVARRLGLGFETAVGYTNLAELVAFGEGPRESLAICRQAIELSEDRGFTHNAMLTRANATIFRFELGEWDEALAEADDVVGWERAEQPTQISVTALTARARVLAGRGDVTAARRTVAELVPLARHMGLLKWLVPTLSAAAIVEHGSGELDRAVELVGEIESSTRANPGWRGHAAADCVRVAVTAGALELAEALLEGADTAIARRRASVASAKALLAETRRDYQQAAGLHTEAGVLWLGLENPLETGQSRLGAGRCLAGLGRGDEARELLGEARAIFERLGARPLVDETEDWLGRRLAG